VTFRWVKGHAGHQWNERCDELAGQAMARSNLPADTYFESLPEEPAATHR
jgi:ribonuclease HI